MGEPEEMGGAPILVGCVLSLRNARTVGREFTQVLNRWAQIMGVLGVMGMRGPCELEQNQRFFARKDHAGPSERGRPCPGHLAKGARAGNNLELWLPKSRTPPA